MNFVIILLISKDWKKNSYNLILVIVNILIKIVKFKIVKDTIAKPK